MTNLTIFGVDINKGKQAMTFIQGTSGNPNGRPKGTGHRQQLFNDLVAPHKEAIFDKAIQLALDGNESMLRLFLERMLPAKPHDEPVNLELPEDLTSRSLLLKMGEHVLRSIANQDISPNQGRIILDLVEEQKKLLQIQAQDSILKPLFG